MLAPDGTEFQSLLLFEEVSSNTIGWLPKRPMKTLGFSGVACAKLDLKSLVGVLDPLTMTDKPLALDELADKADRGRQ